MWKKFCDWVTDKDFSDKIDKIIADEQTFIKSLDARQKAYYLGLGTSWYKAMLDFEGRVFELENKKE